MTLQAPGSNPGSGLFDLMVQSVGDKKPKPPETLTDSLKVMAGGGRVFRDFLIPTLRGTEGLAIPFINQIIMQPDIAQRLGSEHERSVLMHEFGHIADFKDSLPEGVEEFLRHRYNERVREYGGKAGKHGEDEFMADIFMVAVEELQKNSSSVRDGGYIDPEVVVMMGVLLQTDLYKDHPLNDITSARK